MSHPYSRKLMANERVVPVELPNGYKANLLFNKIDGGWQCTATDEFMHDLQKLIRGEELGREYVRPWDGDII